MKTSFGRRIGEIWINQYDLGIAKRREEKRRTLLYKNFVFIKRCKMVKKNGLKTINRNPAGNPVPKIGLFFRPEKSYCNRCKIMAILSIRRQFTSSWLNKHGFRSGLWPDFDAFALTVRPAVKCRINTPFAKHLNKYRIFLPVKMLFQYRQHLFHR